MLFVNCVVVNQVLLTPFHCTHDFIYRGLPECRACDIDTSHLNKQLSIACNVGRSMSVTAYCAKRSVDTALCIIDAKVGCNVTGTICKLTG